MTAEEPPRPLQSLADFLSCGPEDVETSPGRARIRRCCLRYGTASSRDSSPEAPHSIGDHAADLERGERPFQAPAEVIGVQIPRNSKNQRKTTPHAGSSGTVGVAARPKGRSLRRTSKSNVSRSLSQSTIIGTPAPPRSAYLLTADVRRPPDVGPAPQQGTPRPISPVPDDMSSGPPSPLADAWLLV